MVFYRATCTLSFIRYESSMYESRVFRPGKTKSPMTVFKEMGDGGKSGEQKIST